MHRKAATHRRHLDHTHWAYGARAYGRRVVRVELVVHEAADDRRLANRLVSDEDLRRTAQ